VLGAWRADLALFLARQLHAGVTSRVRLDSVVVEDHRQHARRLSDRLLAQAGLGEPGDQIGDVVRLELGRGVVAEAGEKAAVQGCCGLRRRRLSLTGVSRLLSAAVGVEPLVAPAQATAARGEVLWRVAWAAYGEA